MQQAATSPDEVVIVGAVRTPFGKRNGGLSSAHAFDVLGLVQRSVLDTAGVDASTVGQVIGGCVMQVGVQALNVTRGAWLAAGLPQEVPASSIDAQCGSSQQATTLAYGLIAGGVVDVAMACGVEMMSRVPMGSTIPKEPDVGKPMNRSYWDHHEHTSQFEAAERVAEKWDISRADCDEYGARSQDRAAAAWAAGRFDTQIVPVSLGDQVVERDEGLRPTTAESLATLRPTGRPDGVHTAGTSSQIADGAAAVLLTTRRRADQLGVRPLATIVDTVLVGADPALMLEGPIVATRALLERNRMGLDELDLVEVNEAFASVVLSWQRALDADMSVVNPNGGAIAMGHPLGATGAALITKAVHELMRTGEHHALVTMCCAGGLGTGTLLRREPG